MAEKRKQKKLFPLFMLLYAVVFLIAVAFGLQYFWGYMDAYEKSRPNHTLDTYTQQLSPEYICDASVGLIASIDHNVQSEESCRQVILDALQERLTCIKKPSECTEDKLVYVILCGTRVVGSMTMEAVGEPFMGFSTWAITGDSFDLSYLLTPAKSVTVPHDYQVWSGENLLTGAYITEDQIPYDDISEFYGQGYTLPYMVTYEAGPFLGEVELTVTDPEGTPAVFDETTDMNAYIDNCTVSQKEELDSALHNFVYSYVDFISRKNNDSDGNYRKLSQYIVPKSDLQSRIIQAMKGLMWVTDRNASVESMDVNHYVDLGGGRYLCDITYTVNTRDISGSIQAVSGLKIIFLETDSGLKAESMLTY